MNELLQLLKENNILLKQIISMLQKEENEDFSVNVLANIVAERLMNLNN